MAKPVTNHSNDLVVLFSEVEGYGAVTYMCATSSLFSIPSSLI